MNNESNANICNMIEYLKQRIDKIEEQKNIQIEGIFNTLSDRIKKIEDKYKYAEKGIIDLHVNIESYKGKCDKLEKRINELDSQDRNGFEWQKGQIDAIILRIQETEKQNINLVNQINKLQKILHETLHIPNVVWDKHNKIPHKCPVCDGTRIILSKENTLSWQCESCEGKGIVWG